MLHSLWLFFVLFAINVHGKPSPLDLPLTVNIPGCPNANKNRLPPVFGPLFGGNLPLEVTIDCNVTLESSATSETPQDGRTTLTLFEVSECGTGIEHLLWTFYFTAQLQMKKDGFSASESELQLMNSTAEAIHIGLSDEELQEMAWVLEEKIAGKITNVHDEGLKEEREIVKNYKSIIDNCPGLKEKERDEFIGTLKKILKGLGTEQLTRFNSPLKEYVALFKEE